MRNLYSRLGINQDSNPGEIRQAIASCSNATLRKDAEEVLLVTNRRRTYDTLHSVLMDIGILRASLGLNHGDNWQGSDYTQDPSRGHSAYEALFEKINSANKQAKTQKLFDSIKGFIWRVFRLGLGFAFIIGVLWSIGIILDTYDYDSKPKKSTITSHISQPQPRQKSTNTGRISQPPRQAFMPAVLQLPNNGFTRRHTTAKEIAPLEIRTSQGSNYLVKLENIFTGKNIMDIFIRGGSTIKFEVPLGSYRIKYATGKNWYGYKHYFGRRTGYNKADTAFHFKKDGNRISGYTITLYPVANGNLRTSRIDASQF